MSLSIKKGYVPDQSYYPFSIFPVYYLYIVSMLSDSRNILPKELYLLLTPSLSL